VTQRRICRNAAAANDLPAALAYLLVRRSSLKIFASTAFPPATLQPFVLLHEIVLPQLCMKDPHPSRSARDRTIVDIVIPKERSACACVAHTQTVFLCYSIASMKILQSAFLFRRDQERFDALIGWSTELLTAFVFKFMSVFHIIEVCRATISLAGASVRQQWRSSALWLMLSVSNVILTVSLISDVRRLRRIPQYVPGLLRALFLTNPRFARHQWHLYLRSADIDADLQSSQSELRHFVTAGIIASPRTLKDSCRLTVRATVAQHCCGTGIVRSLLCLPLPRSLLSYVCYVDELPGLFLSDEDGFDEE
jgi:hypothetical protein